MSLLCLSLGNMLEERHTPPMPMVNTEKWPETIAYAKRNKLNILLERALRQDGNTAPQYKDLIKDAEKVASGNSHILHLIRKTHLTLESAGIKHIFYKGPLQQKILYGDFFAKPSIDADLLVSQNDFSRSRELLVNAGFSVPAECHRLWWRQFLGEQHLFRDASVPHSVDLHHRLQQPGSPPPKYIEDFLNHPTSVKLGTLTIPTPDIKYISLIAAMNLVKAIYHRQSGGSHAMDLLTALHKMNSNQLEATREVAKHQGLWRTMRFAARISATVFGITDRFSSKALTFPFDDSHLESLLLCPDEAAGAIPRRRTMLRYLSDHPPTGFPFETGRWLLSEGARISPWF